MKKANASTGIFKAALLVFSALSVLSGLLSAGIPAQALGGAALLPDKAEERRAAGGSFENRDAVKKEEETRYLIPCGTPFGVRFYTDGALVSRVEKGSPAELAGVAAGDVITALDGKKIKDAAEWLYEARQKTDKGREIRWTRDGQPRRAILPPDERYEDGGIRVRDCLAGIGTLTFIDPETRRFAGLGHGICRDNGAGLLPLGHGSICNVRITSVLPGAPGAPGQLRGSFCPGEIGSLGANNGQGIYGRYGGALPDAGALPAAKKEEVKEGEAEILCTLDDGRCRRCGVRIEKILSFDASGRNYLLRVTDSELLEKTGGIVQGMSGSPILQNGRIVGAVTHVLVEDPGKGYGIFIGNMLDHV